jgi:hypothetical protein
MSCYICKDSTIAKVANYINTLTANGDTFEKTYTLLAEANYKAWNERYNENEVFDFSAVNPYLRNVTGDIEEMADLLGEYDYQACDWSGYDVTGLMSIVRHCRDIAKRTARECEGL